jgi:hypothetical protein
VVTVAWLQIGELTARPFELLCRDLSRVSDNRLHKKPSAIAMRNTFDALADTVKSERLSAELTLPSFACFVTDLVGYAHASYPTAATAVPSGEYGCPAGLDRPPAVGSTATATHSHIVPSSMRRVSCSLCMPCVYCKRCVVAVKARR